MSTRPYPIYGSHRYRPPASLRSNSCSNSGIHSPTRNTPDYKPIKMLGKGAFGIVYSANSPSGELVAVKKVLEDPRYKNRELAMLKLLHHHNCITLKASFKTKGTKRNEVYLNIVMEYLPISLHSFVSAYRDQKMFPPLFFVRLFAFQLFAGLNYLHNLQVTHRDIKPENVLVDPNTGILKICDFGSAKQIKPGEASISYIASRFYRAPELLFGSTHYAYSIDIWSAGCVVAELVNSGSPLFQGRDTVDQLVHIINVIGPPSEEDLRSFDHDLNATLPQQAITSLSNVLPKHTPPDLLDLLSKIFVYNPQSRISAQDCLLHPFFDELFERGATMPNHHPLPRLDRHLSLPKLGH